MPINSRDKGKRVELQIAKELRAMGIDVHRTAQSDGKMSADLAGWDGVHLECKGPKRCVQVEQHGIAEGISVLMPVTMLRDSKDQAMIFWLVDAPGVANAVSDSGGELRVGETRLGACKTVARKDERHQCLTYLDQAERDAKGDDIPVVIIKANRKPTAVLIRESNLGRFAAKVMEVCNG